MLCRSTEETPLYDLLRLFRDQQNLSSPFVDIVLKFGQYLYLNVKIKSVSPNFDGHSGFIFTIWIRSKRNQLKHKNFPIPKKCRNKFHRWFELLTDRVSLAPDDEWWSPDQQIQRIKWSS